MTAPSPSSLHERAQAQRERILAAAKQCFIEQGFHVASMATIAETAQMSPGLIYRYFKSKNEIILAIVEDQLHASRDGIRALHDSADFGASLYGTFNRWCKKDPRMMNAALLLETSAEASRNKALAASLRTSDREVRAELCNWLSAPVADGGKGLPAEAARVRALMLQMFVEGMSVRALREPDLPKAEVEAVIEKFLEGLFDPEE